MSLIRENMFDLLWNAFLQIVLFAIVTALFSPLVAKARAKYQHVFYLAVFLFCLTVPVINTIWQAHPIPGTGKSLQQISSEAGGPNHHFWEWQVRSQQHEQFTLGSGAQSWIVAIWGCLLCVGWSTSAVVSMAFIGCGKTPQYFLLPTSD